MAFITELDIVNACLKSMGRSPLNSLAGGSPIIASALDSMRTAMMEQQGIGWWFNKETVVLTANTVGEVYVPTDTLVLNTDENPPWLSIRGSRLYDNRVGGYLNITGDITVHLTRLIPLDELPYTAARLVQTATVVDFQSSYDADDAKIKAVTEAYQAAFIVTNTEHIRAVKANLLYNGSGGQRAYRQRIMYPDHRWRS